MNQPKFYNVSEFAKRIGVSQSSLRNWDRTGFLTPHHKTPGGHRFYSEEQAVKYLDDFKVSTNLHSNAVSLSVLYDADSVIVDGLDNLSDLQLSMLSSYINSDIEACKQNHNNV